MSARNRIHWKGSVAIPIVALASILAACTSSQDDTTASTAAGGGGPAASSGAGTMGAGNAGGGSVSSGAGATGAGGGGSACPGGGSIVTVNGYQVIVRKCNPDGTLAPPVPYDLKGIGWSPFGIGENHDGGTGKVYSNHADMDIPLMNAAHINTVKTYDAFERNAAGMAVLDKLHENGMMVAMSVLAGYDNNTYTEAVEMFKDHPAVLMWVIGNEWNYNKLYSGHTVDECAARVNEVAEAIHAIDQNHPVATSFGEIPTDADLAKVPAPDVWLINIYPYLSFADRFDRWKARSTKPMIVGEYGSDVYHRNADGTGYEDQDSQSMALQALTTEIRANLSAQDPGHVCVGGTPYAWNDEWWKSGDPSTHDTDGFAHGGIYSDGHATEEWWGIVDAARTPRKAYTTLQGLYQ